MKLYSNEIVFRGHPDKVCDQISDAIIDAYIEQDRYSRCAVETMGGKGKVFVTGEVSSVGIVDIPTVAKDVLRKVGYNYKEYEIINNIGIQSSDIAQGVDIGGAGDQGMMFGYACNDTSEMLPTAMVILQRFSNFYDEIRQRDNRFLSDGKCQITGYYNDDFKLKNIKTFTLSYQNTELERRVTDRILINKVLDICSEYGIDVEEFLINPTGKFLIGGFEGDSGLTGRKIVVDSYHSFANVGGGAFSGKDSTKVDRSGAYKARQLAKRILKEKKLKWCEIQLSYAIGIQEPLAIYIDSNIGSIKATDSIYGECCVDNIIRDLKLRRPIFQETAKFGHFGNLDFEWEKA